MTTGNYRRLSVLGFGILFLILAFLIIRPFLVAILSAAALAYLFYPLYLRTLGVLPQRPFSKNLASIFTCFIIILIVVIPLGFVSYLLGKEIKEGYFFFQEFIRSPVWPEKLPTFIRDQLNNISQYRDFVNDFVSQSIFLLQNILRGIPNFALNIFITIFSTYYFLKHGRDLYIFFKGLLPLPEHRYQQILTRFDTLSRSMILGQILVGLVQGILAGVGFLFLGVPNPVLWGFLTAIISIIPLLGAALVWVPIMVYLFVIGYISGEYWRAIALLVYGTFVISLIDNIMKPKIVSEGAKIHPLIILFGILGGLQLFGIPGILIGPLVLAFFDVVIEIYKEAL